MNLHLLQFLLLYLHQLLLLNTPAPPLTPPPTLPPLFLSFCSALPGLASVLSPPWSSLLCVQEMGVQVLGACPLPSEELIFLVSFNVMLILSFSCCFLPAHPPGGQAQGLDSWCTVKPTLSQLPESQSLADLAAL